MPSIENVAPYKSGADADQSQIGVGVSAPDRCSPPWIEYPAGITASQREDRGIELAPNLKGGPGEKLVRKLLTEGLIEEVRAAGSLPVWRRDEGDELTSPHSNSLG